MITLLGIFQAIATVIMAAVGLFCRKPTGGLTLIGWVLFVLSAFTYIIAAGFIHNVAENARHQSEVFLSSLQQYVMTTPPGPAMSPGSLTPQFIQIVNPKDGSMVESRYLIEGKVADPKEEVWVVIHPMDTSSYWVQPRVSIHYDGAWKVNAYFGRSGDIDKGKKFEVIAISKSSQKLNEGEILDTWPAAEWISKSIIVTRE